MTTPKPFLSLRQAIEDLTSRKDNPPPRSEQKSNGNSNGSSSSSSGISKNHVARKNNDASRHVELKIPAVTEVTTATAATTSTATASTNHATPPPRRQAQELSDPSTPQENDQDPSTEEPQRDSEPAFSAKPDPKEFLNVLSEWKEDLENEVEVITTYRMKTSVLEDRLAMLVDLDEDEDGGGEPISIDLAAESMETD